MDLVDDPKKQSRHWCFTIWNTEMVDDFESVDWDTWTWCRYVVAGREFSWGKHVVLDDDDVVCEPEFGEYHNGLQPHWQGYVEFTEPKRLSWLKNNIHRSAWWGIRRGTREDAQGYAMKDGDYIERGTWVGVGGDRSDLAACMSMVKQGASELAIAEAAPDTWARNYRALDRYRMLSAPRKTWKPRVVVYFGATGMGKSRRANAELEKEFGVPPHEQMGKWWDGYDAHEGVHLDEFDGQVPLCKLLKLMDYGRPVVETKGGTRVWLCKTLYITSHGPPESWYKFEGYEDRLPEVFRRIDHMEEVDRSGTWYRVPLGNTGQRTTDMSMDPVAQKRSRSE